jgi:hypothetical protein
MNEIENRVGWRAMPGEARRKQSRGGFYRKRSKKRQFVLKNRLSRLKLLQGMTAPGQGPLGDHPGRRASQENHPTAILAGITTEPQRHREEEKQRRILGESFFSAVSGRALQSNFAETPRLKLCVSVSLW